LGRVSEGRVGSFRPTNPSPVSPEGEKLIAPQIKT
jgi:hypothetical protein